MPSDTRLENVPDRADTSAARGPGGRRPRARRWSTRRCRCRPRATRATRSAVSRPFVSSAAIWPDCWPTPLTTSQIEPTTTAVRPSSTRSAPPDRGTPRACEPLDERGEQRAEHGGEDQGHDEAGHLRRAATARRPRTRARRRAATSAAPPHQAGDAATDQPALRGSARRAPPPGAADGHPRRGAIVGARDRGRERGRRSTADWPRRRRCFGARVAYLVSRASPTASIAAAPAAA